MTAAPKKPQDHKSPTEPSYVWTAPDGRKVTLKNFDRLPSGVFRKARGLSEIDSTFALIEAATDDAGLLVIDDLPIGELEHLFAEWTEASGTTAPQS